MLAALPSRHREVLLLMVVEEFSAAEAAAVCQTTPEAMQALARKYLDPQKSWRLAVVPEAKGVAAK